MNRQVCVEQSCTPAGTFGLDYSSSVPTTCFVPKQNIATG